MKITIELDGLRMVLPDEMLTNVTLNIPMGMERCDCDCPIPCKSVHQRLTGTGTFELKAKLLFRPSWEEVDA